MRLPRALLCCLTATLGLLSACTAAGAGSSRNPVAVASRSPLPLASGHPVPPAATPRLHERKLPARFYGAVLPFTPAFARQLRRTTWHRGCPLPLRDLRMLTLRYWGFDHQVHQGFMEINVSVAHDVVTVFRKLFRARFEIKDMELAHRYIPGLPINHRSKADITDGFNCRPVVTARGAATRWSMHSYGLAIDINQLQNPYVTSSGYVDDVYSRRYRNRSLHLPGMIHAGGIVVRAFASIGWHWGGSWPGDKDYMHFSSNGH